MTHLLLIGCGKMGSALLNRWKQSPAITHFDVIDPSQTHANESSIQWHRHLNELPAQARPDVVVLAVKPQQLESVLPDYKIRFAHHSPLYLSIAAGKNLAFYARHLGEHAHIVRAMPNTPALIGEGMTVLCSAPTLSASSRKMAGDLMKAVGAIEWLEDESLMDAVTAISGCGPAYVFLFVESLIKAGISIGLSETLAKNLALQTLSGSVKLAEHSAKTMEQLRIDVASPGGATEAALAQLMAGNALQELVVKAVKAAQTRSNELS